MHIGRGVSLGLLRAPVGNNLDNDPKDVENLKRNFAKEGRYKEPVDNGYHDQELEDALWSFQKDHNLKQDGRANPGGETEATLIGVLRGWQKPQPKNPNVQIYMDKLKRKNQCLKGVRARYFGYFFMTEANKLDRTYKAEPFFIKFNFSDQNFAWKGFACLLCKDQFAFCDDILNCFHAKNVGQLFPISFAGGVGI